MNNLIDIYMSYKTNCLIEYTLIVYNKDNKFIRKVLAKYFSVYIDNYYYNIFQTIDDTKFNLENLHLEFNGIMEEMLFDYKNYELEVSNEEYSRNIKIIKELNAISFEITRIDRLNYKDKDDINNVIEEFVTNNKTISDLIDKRVNKLISLVKKYYININKISDYKDEFFNIKTRSFIDKKNYKYLYLDKDIKALNMYRIGLVNKVYRDEDFYYDRFLLLLRKLSIDIINNIESMRNNNKLYFIEFSDKFINRGNIVDKVYKLLNNPIIRKHVVLLVDFNTYLNNKDLFNDNFIYGCIQNYMHINDIYKKTDSIVESGIFKYLVVRECKYKDRAYFLEYANEKLEVLMFEEE